MSFPSRPLRVFLCHSSHDKAAVRALYQRLDAEGWIDAWLDAEKLYPGQDWNLEIEKAVEAADVILVCLSKSSVTRDGYVQRELRIVLDVADYKPEGTLFVIPLRLEEVEPPRRVRTWQYVDYFPKENHDPAYSRLLTSLEMRAIQLGISPLLVTQNKRHYNSLGSSVAEGRYTPQTQTKVESTGPTSIAHSVPKSRRTTLTKKPVRAMLIIPILLVLIAAVGDYIIQNGFIPRVFGPTVPVEVVFQTLTPGFTNTPHTVTPTFQPTFTPTPPVGIITANSLYLRAGPGNVYSAIGVLSDAQQVVILGTNFERTWLFIYAPGMDEAYGWVAKEYVYYYTVSIYDFPIIDGTMTPSP